VLGLCPAVAGAQVLTLSLDKTSFLPAEPFAVHVTVAVAEPMMIPASLEARHGHVRFYVSAPDGSERLFRPWALFENPAMARALPGQPAAATSRIFFGADGWTFREPGRYRVRAQLGDRSSAPVTLEIRPAAGTEQEQSAALLASPAAGMFLLLDGGDQFREGMALLRGIAGTSTRFSGYAAHSLGTSQAVRFSNLATGQVRPANDAEARRLLERARVLLPADAWHFKASGAGRLEAVLRQQGRADLALQVQQDFAAEIQKANLSPAVRAQIQRSAVIRR